MSVPADIAVAVLATLLVRQSFVAAAIVRARRFVRAQKDNPMTGQATVSSPRFFVVIPVLREAALINETVTHFLAIGSEHAAQLVIVTTERERADATDTEHARDTVAVAVALARDGAFVHLHYPDPTGLKADQLNLAAAYCASVVPDEAIDSTFLVCYDADSRPPKSSLGDFAQAIHATPSARVFHQSSTFALAVHSRRDTTLLRRAAFAVCDGGALRANRFVLGFEIPRLRNRSDAVSPRKQWLSSFVYAHVTGHGLCIGVSLVHELPFPARSPLEDMHYSFYLASRGLPMVAVPSMDRAEVPNRVRAQVSQAARWFVGPARFRHYLRDPHTHPGWRARLLALSALGSSLEWLGCAVVPPLAAWLLLTGNLAARIEAALLAGLYLGQLVLVERSLGGRDPPLRRIIRVLACPIATVCFGIGGFIGAARLLTGRSPAGKTERTVPR